MASCKSLIFLFIAIIGLAIAEEALRERKQISAYTGYGGWGGHGHAWPGAGLGGIGNLGYGNLGYGNLGYGGWAGRSGLGGVYGAHGWPYTH